MKLSSTHRERLAQLNAVSKLHPLFDNCVICINDNQNTSLYWHEVDSQFRGVNLKKFTLYQEQVHYSLWQPRTELPALTDSMARALEETLIAYDNCLDLTKNPVLTKQTVSAAVINHEASIPSDHSMEISSNLACVPLFVSELQNHYLTDTVTTYQHVPMHQICAALFDPSKTTPKVRKLLRHFILHDGLVVRARYLIS